MRQEQSLSHTCAWRIHNHTVLGKVCCPIKGFKQPVLGEFLFMQRLAYERVHCNVIAMNGCRDLRAEVEDCR